MREEPVTTSLPGISIATAPLVNTLMTLYQTNTLSHSPTYLYTFSYTHIVIGAQRDVVCDNLPHALVQSHGD